MLGLVPSWKEVGGDTCCLEHASVMAGYKTTTDAIFGFLLFYFVKAKILFGFHWQKQKTFCKSFVKRSGVKQTFQKQGVPKAGGYL